jgi:xanthine dehydrogenase accessory factor
VMNHHVERDRESLRYCLASAARYIGVLGPRPRYDKMLAALAAEGCTFATDALSRVRSPVGLALGAETPGEVAVAVLSEILAVGRGFDGGFLNGSLCSLHVRGESSSFARS